MQSYSSRTRLYLDVPVLKVGLDVALPASAVHYLRSVLRTTIDDHVHVFNGRDGAFEAQITALGKSAGAAHVGAQVAPQDVLPKLALAFCIIKKERVQMVVEKAAELGAARIVPVISARVQGQAVKQVKPDKLEAYAIEACEQCGRTALPTILPIATIDELLNQDGQLLYADEMQAGSAARWPAPNGWTTLLIGPEGGWSPEERAALAAAPSAHPVTLGPRILRAETASIAALTLWQSQFGDWRP